MPIKLTFDPIDKKRIYLDSGYGCRGKCLYCYVPDIGYNSIPSIDFYSGKQLAEFLTKEQHFVIGKYGTIVSLGSCNDPLDPSHIKKTEEILFNIMPFGNPIQIASKCFDKNETIINKIATYQRYDAHLTLLATITTFHNYKWLEPNTPSPTERLQVLEMFMKANVNTALLIKPMIPTITDREVDYFVDAIKNYRIMRCVVGIFYMSDRMMKTFINQAIDRYISKDTYQHPKDNDKRLIPVFDNVSVNNFIRNLQNITDVKIFKNSICVIANSLNIPNPIRTWERHPDLCIQCQDCGKLEKRLQKIDEQ